MTKKGLGNIKPMEDDIYQNQIFSFSPLFLSNIGKKGQKKRKTHLKSQSRITY